MDSIPKYIKFTILSLNDIQRMSETSRYWYKLISMAECWQFMINQHYDHTTLIKPASLTMRELYLRIKNSGDLYVASDNCDEKLKLPLKNICHIRQCGDRYYFIDVYGEVRYGMKAMIMIKDISRVMIMEFLVWYQVMA